MGRGHPLVLRNAQPYQRLLFAPDGPPTGLYSPKLALQPPSQPPLTAFAISREYRTPLGSAKRIPEGGWRRGEGASGGPLWLQRPES